jgi:RND family efflux transporter MFP subunit
MPIVKKAIGAVAIILALGVAAYFLRGKLPQGMSLSANDDLSAPTVKVQRQLINTTIESAGDVAPAPDRQVEIKSEVSEKIKSVKVVIGQKVKKGDLLIELDDRDLITSKDSADILVEGAKVTLDRNQRNFERAEKLYDRKLLSQEDYENARSDRDSAKNAYDSAKSNLDQVLYNLSKTKILSPIDSTVLLIPVVEGQVAIAAASVNSGTSLMTVADLSTMNISTHVNQVDIAKIRAKEKVSITVDSLRDVKMTGIVDLISPIADIKNNVKGFTVNIIIQNLDPRVRPGMTANVTFPVVSLPDALSLPISAIFTEDDDKKVVYVQPEDPKQPAVRKQVEIGVSNFDLAEIKSGLKEGEAVLLSRPSKIHGG